MSDARREGQRIEILKSVSASLVLDKKHSLSPVPFPIWSLEVIERGAHAIPNSVNPASVDH